ncbi:MAG: DUF1330 domain-containing protein [Gammaproteobacteria bacterium]|nr:DUF1330 domain-containing protein [Gammaproteobacteria bacterium]
MPAYLLGQIAVHNESLWQEYLAGVARSLEPFEAHVLFRGKKVADLAGNNPRELAVVIEFKDQLDLNNWFNSDLYQSIISTRDAAADVVITSYNT